MSDASWAALAAVTIAVIGPGGVWVVLMGQRRTLGRVERHTENVGNGFTGHVLDGIDAIRAEQVRNAARIEATNELLAHLTGRFEQHVIESREKS